MNKIIQLWAKIRLLPIFIPLYQQENSILYPDSIDYNIHFPARI